MTEIDLNAEIDRALQIYNTASPHIKERESMRLLGLLAKALRAIREQHELEIQENAILATWEWLEHIGLNDVENFRYQKMYWIVESAVHVVARAVSGGWKLSLYTGTGLRINDPTRGQINAIRKALRGEA